MTKPDRDHTFGLIFDSLPTRPGWSRSAASDEETAPGRPVEIQPLEAPPELAKAPTLPAIPNPDPDTKKRAPAVDKTLPPMRRPAYKDRCDGATTLPLGLVNLR